MLRFGASGVILANIHLRLFMPNWKYLFSFAWTENHRSQNQLNKLGAWELLIRVFAVFLSAGITAAGEVPVFPMPAVSYLLAVYRCSLASKTPLFFAVQRWIRERESHVRCANAS